MTKAEFVKEFEERTGRRLHYLSWHDDRAYLSFYHLAADCRTGRTGGFWRQTVALYSRAHLNAAIAAVGEKEDTS